MTKIKINYVKSDSKKMNLFCRINALHITGINSGDMDEQSNI